MTYDGSVNFSTNLDTDGYEQGVKKLSSKSIELVNKIKNTENEINFLKSELKELAETPVKTNTILTLEKQVDTAKAKLNELYEEADRIANSKIGDLKDTGFNLSDDDIENLLAQDNAWSKIQSQIDVAETKLIDYERELNNAKAVTENMSGKDTAEYRQKSMKLEELTGNLNVYKARLSETEAAENAASNSTSKSTQETSRYNSSLSTATSGLKKLISALSKAGKTLLSAFKSSAVNLIKKIGTNAKSSAKQTNLLEKALNRIKQILLGLIVYKGIRSMFSSIGESLQDIAEFSPEFNKNMSALVSKFTQLKNAIATAFVPLINFVTPILTSFMDVLTKATDKVAQFFAAITGNSTYTKAIDVQTDYAESLSDTTEATEASTAATEENQKSLAGYDELNVMQDTSSTSSTANNTDDNTATAYTTADVTSAVDGFADKIKSMLANQDFKGIGSLISEKINDALGSISWENIRKTAKKYAANIADFLNGAIEKLDWTLVGSTIGNGLMTGFDFAYTFLTTFDFETLGSGIANALNGFISSMDWSTVGATFGAALQSIISLGFGFVTTFDWVGAGLSLSEIVNSFFNEIDWKMAAQTISDGILGLFATLTEFFENVDWEKIGEDIGTFLMNIDWEQIFLDLLGLLWSCVTGLWDMLKGMIGEMDLANWFRNLFDESAGPLYDIFNFIGDAIDNCMKILDGLITFIDGVFSGDWEEAWNGICEFFEGIWNNIWATIKYIINMIIGGINDLWTGIYDAVKGIVDGVGGIAGAIGDVFGQDWHFSMPSEPPLIPKLATGTVVPANYGEFLATLGDNKREPEVVSPLSTMKQALAEVLAEGGFGDNGGDINLTVTLDGDVVFKSVVNKNNRYKKSHGKSALA
jgi:hypothetical protein